MFTPCLAPLSFHTARTRRFLPLETLLPVGVSVSVNVLVYMCVSYVSDRKHVHASCPVHAGMDSIPSEILNRISSSENGWRVGLYVSNATPARWLCVEDHALMALNNYQFRASLMIFERGRPQTLIL